MLQLRTQTNHWCARNMRRVASLVGEHATLIVNHQRAPQGALTTWTFGFTNLNANANSEHTQSDTPLPDGTLKSDSHILHRWPWGTFFFCPQAGSAQICARTPSDKLWMIYWRSGERLLFGPKKPAGQPVRYRMCEIARRLVSISCSCLESNIMRR